MSTKTQQAISDIEKELLRLLDMIEWSGVEIAPMDGLPPYRTVWRLWDGPEQIGQVEARFGSEYSDEPDGFAVYLVGYRWTDYCPTVESCVKQHHERKL